MRKAFLSAKNCKALLALKEEVKSVMMLMDRQILRPKGEVDGERAVDFHIDDKKSITVRKWCDNVRPEVMLQTWKEGEKQQGLAFNLSEEEWLTMQAESSVIQETIQDLSTTIYAEADSRIKMYRWVAIKMDGSGLSSVADRWEYIEADAKRDAEVQIQPGEKIMIEYRRVEPPTRQQLYTAAQVFLIRKVLNQIRKDGCPGCVDPPEANQLGHVIGGGFGCLDDDAEINDSLFDKAKRLVSSMENAELFHTVASAINIPNSSSNAVKDDGAIANRVKLAVLSTEWDGSELEDLCRRVHFREIRAQQSTLLV